jgi:hypothetical protein
LDKRIGIADPTSHGTITLVKAPTGIDTDRLPFRTVAGVGGSG